MAVTTPSDTELLHQARRGDPGAFTGLYARHWAAALRLAHSYGAGADAEDLVNDAFERVMGAVRRGGGPEGAFRPYLYVTLRHLAMERCSRPHHVPLDAVPESVIAVSGLPALDVADRGMIAQAFSDLPDRWQAVLWQIAVEGRRPRDVARATGMRANSVSVLAHRARERLRETYLQAHVGAGVPDLCMPYRRRLGAYVRGGLSRRQRAAADEHVAACESCGRLVAELDDVNRLLARAVLPAFALGGGQGLALGAGTAGTAGLSAAAAPAASGAASTGGAVGVGFGVGAKVAAVAVAVVGLVALVPHDVGPLGDDPPTVEAVGPAGPVDQDTASTSAPLPQPPVAATDPTTLPAGGVPPGATQAPAAPGPGEGPEPAVAADLDVGLPAADVQVSADVEVGLETGIAVDASWTVGPVGTGTLAVAVANSGHAALVDGEIVVDLSPGAHATTLLGTGCDASDPPLLDLGLSLLRRLTCRIDDVAAQSGVGVTIPLAVVGPDQLATVSVRRAPEVLATAVVPLAQG